MWGVLTCPLLLLIVVIFEVTDGSDVEESNKYLHMDINSDCVEFLDQLKHLETAGLMAKRCLRSIDEEFQQPELQDQCNNHYEHDEYEACNPQQGTRNGQSTYGLNMLHVFSLGVIEKPWPNGFIECEMGSNDFAIIKNSEERKSFADALTAGGWNFPMEHFWVAAAENSSAIGGFSWIDGREVHSDAWAMGYPKVYGTKPTCVSMGIETSMLFNFDCRISLLSVCFAPR